MQRTNKCLYGDEARLQRFDRIVNTCMAVMMACACAIAYTASY